MSKYDDCKKYCTDYLIKHGDKETDIPHVDNINEAVQYQMSLQYMIGYNDGVASALAMMNKEDK